jgi:peptidoglycan/LPS O-acetylase OafA/YrhL
VFHALGLEVAARMVGTTRWGVDALIGVAVTAALATASYYVLERPFLRWKRRFTYVTSGPGGSHPGLKPGAATTH